MKKLFRSMILAMLMLLLMMSVSYAAHSHAPCGKSGSVCTHDHSAVEYTGWDGTTALSISSGTSYIYLTNDVQLTSILKVEKGATLYLCLNGYDLYGKKYYEDMLIYGTLYLCDCSSEAYWGSVTHLAGERGRGITISSGGKMYFYSGKISGNDAYVDNGGGIHNSGTLYMYGGEVSNNSVTYSSAAASGKSGRGGGIYNYFDAWFYLYGGTIANNTADDGGGVHNRENMIMTGGTIANNTADDGGGLFSVPDSSSSTAKITGGVFSGNHAEIQGGGIFAGGANNGTFSCDNVTFTGNTTNRTQGGASGGAIALYSFPASTKPVISNCTFTGNSAKTHGGALYISTTSCTLKNLTITGNSSAEGGGISVLGTTDETVILENVKVQNNTSAATYYPNGGVYLTSTSGSIYLRGNTVITGNRDTVAGVEANLTVYDGSTDFVYVDDSFNGTVGVSLGYKKPTASAPVACLKHEDTSKSITNATLARFTSDQGYAKRVNSSGVGEFFIGTQLTVVNGSGTGQYGNGEVVTITADAPATDENFAGWKVTEGSVTLADASSATTTLTMGTASVTVEAQYSKKHVHAYCGSSCGHTSTHGSVEYLPWDGSSALTLSATQPNYIYLTADVTRNPCINMKNKETLYLCLNGHDLIGGSNNPTIIVDSNAQLYLCDCSSSANWGSVTHPSGVNGKGVDVETNAKFYFFSGKISGNSQSYGAGVENSGTMYMYGGEISGNSATDGGGVRNNNSMYMYGGKITNNQASTKGGGVYSLISFTMNGGEISGNTASQGGGVYNTSAFTMKDGSISQNTATGTGGGLSSFATLSGTVSLSGGSITQNKAASAGGGVYIGAKDKLTTTATISNNQVTGNTGTGGGIYIMTGLPNDKKASIGGTVSGNKAKKGAGVYIGANSYVDAANASITGNIASESGGGIYNSSVYTKADSSAITGNQAGSAGAGIYTTTRMAVTGNTQVTGNTVSGTANNAYLIKDAYLETTNAFTGSVGVQTAVAPGMSSDVLVVDNYSSNGVALSQAVVDRFQSDAGYQVRLSGGNGVLMVDLQLTVTNGSGSGTYVRGEQVSITADNMSGKLFDHWEITSGSPTLADAKSASTTLTMGSSNAAVKAVYVDKHMHYTCGSSCGHDASHEQKNYTAWTGNSALKLSSGANYVFLANDINVTSATYQITVDYDQTLYLCMNGHDIKGMMSSYSEGLINVKGDLILCDCQGSDTASWGKITSADAARYKGIGVYGNGDVTMYGGQISGNSNSGSYGGGVNLRGGSFTLYDGAVANNSSAGYGGGVFLEGNASIAIHGGEISGNTARNYGGGVYQYLYENSGTVLTMTGGKVSGNQSSSYGGGIAVEKRSALGTSVDVKISGGEIGGNTAGYAGGIYLQKCRTEMDGGTIKNNSSTGTGGGLYDYKGVATLKGGSITGNESQSEGGGVFIQNDSVLNLQGVTIAGNKAEKGGGVYVSQLGELNMTAGSITDNEADVSGGGIYSADHMTFDGNAAVSGNVAAGEKNNVYLAAGNYIYITNALTGNIGVSVYREPTAELPVIYLARSSGSVTQEDLAHTTSDKSGEMYVKNINKNGKGVFGPLNYTIEAEVRPENAGTVTGTGLLGNGTTAELTAEAAKGYSFVNWMEGSEEVGSDKLLSFVVDGARKLTANFKPNDYTITFDSDGGSAVEAITQAYGSAVTAPADPEKLGHTFTGWEPALPETMPVDGLRVKATWTANTYDAVFNANGGAWADGSASQTVPTVFGEAITAPEDPAWAGHSFVGWTPQVESMTAEGMSFTAAWDVENYTITFDSDGGSEVEAITQAYGSTVTAPADPEKLGHTFTGWEPALPGTMPVDGLRVKATWTANTYEAVFNANGGAWADGSASQTVPTVFGEAITAPEDPAWAGHSFMGWTPQVESMTAEGMSFTAAWDVKNYTITFDSDGGSAVEAITQAYGSAVTAPADPEKLGHTFTGWEPALPGTMPVDGLRVKATWTANTYDAVFNANGGAWADGSTSQTVPTVFGEAITAPEDPAWAGHSFVGWTPQVESMTAEGMSFTAAWDVENYTITFDSDGGSEVEAITQAYGSAVTAPADPEKLGHTFTGWEPALPETMPVDGLRVKATWTANTYDAVFNANGGAWADGSASQTVPTVFGEAITAPEDPAWAGHSFMGWTPQVSRRVLSRTSSLGSMTAEGMTFLAQWDSICTCLLVLPETLPAGNAGEAYSTGCAATYAPDEECADVPYAVSYSVAEGQLPETLQLDMATGQLSGEPAKAGSYTFSITAVVHEGTKHEVRTTKQYTLVIHEAVPDVYTVSVTGGDGSGEYAEGTLVTITAHTPETGFRFRNWEGLEGLRITLGSAETSTLVFEMPARDVAVTAVCEEIPAQGSAPRIVMPAEEQTLTVQMGESVRLSITAEDAESYQWYVDRNDGAGYVLLKDANMASYLIVEVEPENAGCAYSCVAKNAYGETRSPAITLEIMEEPEIPSTGDNTNIYLWTLTLILSLLGMVLAAASAKKVK